MSRHLWMLVPLLLTMACPQTGDDDAGMTGDGDGDGDGNGNGNGNGNGDGDLALPTANAQFDYQLGGAYPPPDGVTVIGRDRNDAPATGLYNICYVNGFQTQPDEEPFWFDVHPDLLLRDAAGDLVIDPDWDEYILDVTTAAKREQLAAIVGGWIDGCGTAGFDAIEIDNLDTYARSGGLVSQDHAVAFMSLLRQRAHMAGMAIGQKNSTDVLDRVSEMCTDFAIAEQCNEFDECQAYRDVYGDLVFVIEYNQQDFNAGCAAFPSLSIILRDLDLVTEGSGGYIYQAC